MIKLSYTPIGDNGPRPLRFVVGSIALTARESQELRQSYEDIEGFASLDRAGDGSAIVQCFGTRKTRIITSGQSWVSPSIKALALFQTYEILCISAMETRSITPVIAAPAIARPDAPIRCEAQLDDDWEQTGFYRSGSDLILSAVDGALAYRALWYPAFSAVLARKAIDENRKGPGWDWSLTFEEA